MDKEDVIKVNNQNRQTPQRKRKKRINKRKFFIVVGSSLGMFLLLVTIILGIYLKVTNKTLGDFVKDIMRSIPIAEKYKKRVNILVIGLDNDKIRSDVDMLVSFDPKNKSADVFQIPRDTRIIYTEQDRAKILASTDLKDNQIPYRAIKLTESYEHGGIELTKYSVSKVLNNININYYVKVQIKAFRNIVDEVGGVDMYIPQDMHYSDPTQNLLIDLKKGYQHLDGKKAEQFVRFRHYAMGDLTRIQAQRTFLQILGKKVLSSEGALHAIPIMENMVNYTSNDMKASAIAAYVTQAINVNPNSVKFHNIPGDAPPASATGGISYFIYDPIKTDELVNKYIPQTSEETSNDTSDNNHVSNNQITVEILNTTKVNGLAHSLANKLSANGFKVCEVGNWGGAEFENTQIINNNSKINSASNLKKYIDNAEVNSSNNLGSFKTNADSVILIGRDMIGK